MNLKISTAIFVGNFQAEIAERFASIGMQNILLIDDSNLTAKKKAKNLKSPKDIVIHIDFKKDVNTITEKIHSITGKLNPNETIIWPRQEKYMGWNLKLAKSLNLTKAYEIMEKLKPLTDKYQTRNFLEDHMPELTTNFLSLKKVTDLAEGLKKTGFPSILKPVNLSGSIGVYIIRDIVKANKILTEIKANSKFDGCEWILEGIIPGKQYSVDVVVGGVEPAQDVHFMPFVSQKTKFDEGVDDFKILYSQTPSEMNLESKDVVISQITKLVEKLGIKQSVLHIEFKYQSESKTLGIIEINPRLGGFRQDLYGTAFGIDYIGLIIDSLILGKEIDTDMINHKNYARVMYVYSSNTGIYKGIDTSRLVKIQSYTKHREFASIGDKIGPSELGYPKLMNIVLTNSDLDQLDSDYDAISTTINSMITYA